MIFYRMSQKNGDKNECWQQMTCFLQIGKNCSGHVLTLLVVSQKADDRLLSYYTHVNWMRFQKTKIWWMWLSQFWSYVLSRLCLHFLGTPCILTMAKNEQFSRFEWKVSQSYLQSFSFPLVDFPTLCYLTDFSTVIKSLKSPGIL